MLLFVVVVDDDDDDVVVVIVVTVRSLDLPNSLTHPHFPNVTSPALDDGLWRKPSFNSMSSNVNHIISSLVTL